MKVSLKGSLLALYCQKKKIWMQISELKGLNDPFTIENSKNFQRVY